MFSLFSYSLVLCMVTLIVRKVVVIACVLCFFFGINGIQEFINLSALGYIHCMLV